MHNPDSASSKAVTEDRTLERCNSQRKDQSRLRRIAMSHPSSSVRCRCVHNLHGTILKHFGLSLRYHGFAWCVYLFRFSLLCVNGVGLWLSCWGVDAVGFFYKCHLTTISFVFNFLLYLSFLLRKETKSIVRTSSDENTYFWNIELLRILDFFEPTTSRLLGKLYFWDADFFPFNETKN
jgi:hypothetical protein